jgi:hypothetical protein
MHRTLLCLAALMLALGCQNPSQSPSWNNPYAAFGPATVPAATMQTPPQPGYYQPPPATPTLSSTSSTTLPPIVSVPDASSKSSLGGTIRSEISTPAGSQAIKATPSPSTSSFSTRFGSAGEEAIRIVEAAPKTSSGASSKPAFSTTVQESRAPAVVAANPTSRSTATPIKTIPAPGVQFNPSSPTTGSPAEAPPSLNRTRGYLSPPSANPATPAAPKNQVLSVPSIRRDTSVSPATFVDTTSDAGGQWKAR